MISELLQHDPHQVDAYFAIQHKEIRKSITLMQSRLSPTELKHHAQDAGWTIEKSAFLPHSETYLVTRETIHEWLGKHRLHTCGYVYMQEVAASIPAGVLAIPPWGVVLDMCAAPGGKSVQISDALLCGETPGLVISNEINLTRTITLQSNLNRMWAYNTVVTNISGEKWWSLLPNMCDAVLIDAPCSGEGTGFKSDAGTKWRRKDIIDDLVHLQKSLLISGIHACKPGGSIVYATCTINPRENEHVVAHALEQFGNDIELVPTGITHGSPGIVQREDAQILTETQAQSVTRFRPHVQMTGGFFIASFRKRNSTSPTALSSTSSASHKLRLSQLDISPWLQTLVTNRLMTDFGIRIDPTQHLFIATPKQIYITSPLYAAFHLTFPIQKTGIPLYKKDEKGLRRPLHGIGQILGSLATTNTISLSASERALFSQGRDLDWPTAPGTQPITPGFKILLFEKKWVSLGKLIPGTLKNKFLKS